MITDEKKIIFDLCNYHYIKIILKLSDVQDCGSICPYPDKVLDKILEWVM